MEPEIWRRLPEELLEHILSLLPLKTFLSLRPTSKHFESFLFSPTFISSHSPTTTLFSFLVLSHPQFGSTCPLFDTSRSVWRKLPLSDTHAPPSYTLTAISGHRLCFSHPTISSSFLICNLFPKSTEVVKSPNYPCPTVSESVTFLSTGKGASYKLLVLSGSGSSRIAMVYDSLTRGWTRFDGFEESLYNQVGVAFQGKVYFITPEPFQVVSFDMETGAWGKSPPQLPSGEQFVFVRLVASGGGEKLYLIGGIGRNGISRSVKVWEMAVEGGGAWVEIQRLPEMMFKKLAAVCYHKYEHVYCFWHQGLVCVCCYTWPEILYFKVSRGTWHWLPKCPSLLDKWSCGFRWFSLVPQLSALSG